MRKEFEENEESKKTLENNLEIQDEIDDETFQKILEEEFIEREKQIEEALFADEDFEDLKLTDKEVQDSYQELMRRFEEDKKKSAEFSEELVPDEKKVLSMEKVRERRHKTAGGMQRLGKVVGMAVVAVACVFAASMTSEANRTYLVNSVRIWSGDDTKTVVYNDDSNENANPDEAKAIIDIEEKLGVEVPEFYYRPYGMEFLNYTIRDLTSLARIEYRYKTNRIVLLIDKQNDDRSSRIKSTCGDEQKLIVTSNDGTTVEIKQNYDDEETSYSAEWEKNGVTYTLSGKIELEEIKKIIEKMIF
ncbi:DUF4367 domain-containing protein [Blautia sp.]|jgi:hypothetical protein